MIQCIRGYAFNAMGQFIKNYNDNDNLQSFSYLKCITAFKYCKYVHSTLDIESLIYQLECFLSSKSTTLFSKKGSYQYGNLSYKLITDKLTNKSDLNISLKDFHLIYEHKYIMKERIEYMVNKKYIPSNCLLVKRSKLLCEEFLAIRNIYIKLIRMHDKVQIDLNLKLYERINKAKEIEKSLLNDLLYYLKR